VTGVVETDEPSYDEVLVTLFQQRTAYPYPFGSWNLGYLYEQSDAELRTWSWGCLRDQAVSVDEVFAEFKGRYLALIEARRLLGSHPVFTEQIAQALAALHRIHVEKQRLRRLLDTCPQPRRGVERN
jgi:hypothetical protein